jgi:hypothetical protein
MPPHPHHARLAHRHLERLPHRVAHGRPRLCNRRGGSRHYPLMACAQAALVFVLALAAILGALRYDFAQPHFDQTTLATYNDQQKTLIVEGLIVSEPDVRDAYTNLCVEADRLFVTD